MLRVTSKPAASEIKNAGTWLTRPSPIVSRVKSVGRLAEASCRTATTPMIKPPTMLITRDEDAGDGVAADELAGTVHRAVEVGLLRDFARGGAGLRARR